ncbi:hypothetical protein SeLEV6574_g05256 [Synchytrium endobioticum]|uniref:Uncharacterized protein n=1 Tax=Synchytrium endobioticum TaxID=286115 RepID=A0A507CVA4_9FUNG|nr:hypothetical protein SeLEV6574_g05256 [Synchytrium endobioticum]
MKWRCTAKSLMSCRPCRSYDIHAEFRNRVHSNGTIGGQVQTAAGRIHFYANKYIMTKIWSNTDNKSYITRMEGVRRDSNPRPLAIMDFTLSENYTPKPRTRIHSQCDLVVEFSIATIQFARFPYAHLHRMRNIQRQFPLHTLGPNHTGSSLDVPWPRASSAAADALGRLQLCHFPRHSE